MKPLLGDCDTHRLWEGSQGNQLVKHFKAKGVPPSLTFSHAKADCWGIELKILVLVFVVFNLFLRNSTPVFIYISFSMICCDVLRFHFKALAGFFYTCAVLNHGKVLKKGLPGRPCDKNCQYTYTPLEMVYTSYMPGDVPCLSQSRAGSSCSWDVKCWLFPYY